MNKLKEVWPQISKVICQDHVFILTFLNSTTPILFETTPTSLLYHIYTSKDISINKQW